jgi:hypothetical protein
MNITIKKKEVDLKFTFNSFKYMGEFSLDALQHLESKPFKMIPVVEMLLLGAINNNPKVKFKEEDVSEFLEEYIVNESIADLLEKLMDLLQESNFFKSLQKTTPEK